MKKYKLILHNRQSIRLKGHDYSKSGLYFITICVQNRECIFGNVIDGEMALNVFGQIAKAEWENTPYIRKNCKLHNFIIMPNHIHGIIEIIYNKEEKVATEKFQSPSHNIGSLIRGYKIATIKKIKDKITIDSISRGELQFAPTIIIKELDFKIWQRNYYVHIIRNDKSYQRISEYIINNPLKWNDDDYYIQENYC